MTHLRLVNIWENCSLEFGRPSGEAFSLPESAEVRPDLLILKRHAERSCKPKGVPDAGIFRKLAEA
jgi:hypothetical protein